MDGSGAGGARRGTRPGARRSARQLARRTASSSARSDRPARGGGSALAGRSAPLASEDAGARCDGWRSRSTNRARQQRRKSTAQLGEVELGRRPPRDHEDVPGTLEVRARGAEPLADTPLQPISGHSTTHASARRDSEPRRTGSLSSRDQDHEGARQRPPTLLRHMLVLTRPEQPLRPPKATGRPGHGYLEGIETAIRLRPFARRRLRTLRPPGVLIRFRKPWTRFRRILLG